MAANSVYMASVPMSKHVAGRLVFELEMRGIKVFQSPTDARTPSDSYMTQIEQADAFLCVIGAEALDDALFKQEIARALWLHKPVLLIFQKNFNLLHSHKATLKPLTERFDHILMTSTNTEAAEHTVDQIEIWLKNPQKKLPPKHRPEIEVEPRSGGQTYHVFLSYSRTDKEFVLRLHRDLTRCGFKVWIDQYELETGMVGWENEIANAIEHSDCVVAVMSPDATQSKWVGRELAKSDDLNRQIFPILARGDVGHAIPLRLCTHQRADATKSYDKGLTDLVTALRNYLEAPAA